MRLVLVDLDGTLLTGPSSERLFIAYLAARGLLGRRQAASFVGFAARFAPRYGRHVWKKNKAYLAGLEVAEVAELAESFVRDSLSERVRPWMKGRIAHHRHRGDTVGLLSGAPEFLLRPLAQRLGIAYWCGTQCTTYHGRYAAQPPIVHPFGADKIAVAQALCRKLDTQLACCVAYADSIHDRAFLERVGTAVAVAPSKRLGRVARTKGWEILAQAHLG